MHDQSLMFSLMEDRALVMTWFYLFSAETLTGVLDHQVSTDPLPFSATKNTTST